MNYNFYCPSCKLDKQMIEEVMCGVILSSNIESIGEDGDIGYGNHSHEDGEIVRYQCVACGHIIRDDFGDTICEPGELYDWLEAKDMLIKPEQVNL